MMGRRYLAILATAAVPLTSHRKEAIRKKALRLTELIDTDRLIVWSDHLHTMRSPAGHAIIGEIFDRGATRPEVTLDETSWLAIANSHGRRLVERYWGNYVAFANGPDGMAVVRAPMGDLGCYYVELEDSLVIASNLDLLSATCGPYRIAPRALALHIAYPEWRHSETCLENIRDLRGGDRLAVSTKGINRTTLWTPWSFVGPDRMIDDPIEGARSLRNAVHTAVRALACDCDRAALLLSGGLDSSIVAASLSAGRVDFLGLNLVGNDAASDERRYAEMVAQRCNVELITASFDPYLVDIHRSGSAHMPYPVHRSFTQAQDRIAAQIATRHGASLVMDGGGGDNVFFAARTISILADCLATSGLDKRFWNTARSLGDLAQTGQWSLAWRAFQRSWRRSPAPRKAASDTFLSEHARTLIQEAPAHPWFVPHASVLPGRASHVSLLVPAQNMVEAVNAQASQRTISPLASQPVVEACLRIPSWRWLAPGRDRAIARAAFANDLPEAIIARRSKGTPNGFVAAIFDQQREAIREMLLGGHLAEMGLIDEGKLSVELRAAGPVRGLNFVRVMELVDAEAWMALHH